MAAQCVGLVRGPSFSKVNPDTIGRVWTGELEYATRGRGNFESRKKKLRIQRYQDTCGRDLRI